MPELNTAADDEADALLRAVRDLDVERVVFAERVAERHQEEVEVDEVEEARHHAELVDAGADRPDQAGGLELGERAIAARRELGEIGGRPAARCGGARSRGRG